MTEYHRDSKRFIEENCKQCALCKDFDKCSGIPVYLGCELKESGIMPDADAKKFYFIDRCPWYEKKEEEE